MIIWDQSQKLTQSNDSRFKINLLLYHLQGLQSMISSVNCGLSPNCFLVARYLQGARCKVPAPSKKCKCGQRFLVTAAVINLQISPIFLLSHLWSLLQDELHLCLCEMRLRWKRWWHWKVCCRGDLAKFSPNAFLLHNQTHHRRRFSWKGKLYQFKSAQSEAERRKKRKLVKLSKQRSIAINSVPAKYRLQVGSVVVLVLLKAV